MDENKNKAVEKTKVSLDVIRTVADVIREVKTVPSSHLYARLMAYMDLDEYNWIIGILKKAGVVSESHYVLTWTGE